MQAIYGLAVKVIAIFGVLLVVCISVQCVTSIQRLHNLPLDVVICIQWCSVFSNMIALCDVGDDVCHDIICDVGSVFDDVVVICNVVHPHTLIWISVRWVSSYHGKRQTRVSAHLSVVLPDDVYAPAPTAITVSARARV
jgi:hypothetical protein